MSILDTILKTTVLGPMGTALFPFVDVDRSAPDEKNPEPNTGSFNTERTSWEAPLSGVSPLVNLPESNGTIALYYTEVDEGDEKKTRVNVRLSGTVNGSTHFKYGWKAFGPLCQNNGLELIQVLAGMNEKPWKAPTGVSGPADPESKLRLRSLDEGFEVMWAEIEDILRKDYGRTLLVASILPFNHADKERGRDKHAAAVLTVRSGGKTCSQSIQITVSFPAEMPLAIMNDHKAIRLQVKGIAGLFNIKEFSALLACLTVSHEVKTGK